MIRNKVKLDTQNNGLLFSDFSSQGEIADDFAFQTITEPLTPLLPCAPFAAVDFETYYSTDYSLKKLSHWDYVSHFAFDAYLVAIARWEGDTFSQWIGHPKAAPWGKIAHLTFVSHNASFDELVYRRLTHDQIINAPLPRGWDCTADLSQWLQAGRSLDLASRNLLGESVSKAVREMMLGGNASPAEMRDYAARDAIQSAKIWARYSAKWPGRERFISRKTRYANWRGVYTDLDRLNQGVAHLAERESYYETQVPWGHTHGVLSSIGFDRTCAQVGLIPPASKAKASEECAQWEKSHGEYPWIQIVRKARKTAQTKSFFESLVKARRKDGTVPLQLNYCAAPHTKRFQSSGGLRVQNLDAQPIEGLEIRTYLEPRPGNKFVIVDSSQIEPRVMAFLCGDTDFLDACRSGLSPYEAHARTSMGYSDPEPLKKKFPLKYKLAKAQVLSLGYGAGAETYIGQARAYCGLHLNLHEATVEDGNRIPSATEQVDDYRRNHPLITRFWRSSERALKNRVGGHYRFRLPSGNSLAYFDIALGRGHFGEELVAWVVKGSPNMTLKKSLYGGKIAQNRVQALARDAFVDGVVRCLAKYPWMELVFTVHDEVLIEVNEAVANDALELVVREMHLSPSWAPELPLAAEGGIFNHYVKD